MSDLVWLDKTPYDQVTGVGAIGVEFAGTAVSSSGYGAGRSIANSSDKSAGLVRDNRELQWAEGYYRGYYELHISPDELNARYYGKSGLLQPSSRPQWYMRLIYIFVRLSIGRNPQPFRYQPCELHCQGWCQSSAKERGQWQRRERCAPAGKDCADELDAEYTDRDMECYRFQPNVHCVLRGSVAEECLVSL